MARYKWIALLVYVLLVLQAPSQVIRVSSLKPKPLLTLGDNLTVTASPSAVSFALVSNGLASSSGPIAVTTSWTGISLLSLLNVYAYFSSASAALSGGTPAVNIPSSCVLGQDTTGIPTTFTAFTQTSPFGGAGASLELYSSGSILSLGGSHTDNLNLEINLATIPELPAGTYYGVLVLQAEAF